MNAFEKEIVRRMLGAVYVGYERGIRSSYEFYQIYGEAKVSTIIRQRLHWATAYGWREVTQKDIEGKIFTEGVEKLRKS